MKIGLRKRFTVINKQASSLYSLIADGQYRNTSLGRNTWKSLIGADASLQSFCNKKGFNVVCSHFSASKARIGLVANDGMISCDSCDSRIRFGRGGTPIKLNTCGNAASYNPDNGNKNIKAFGYILVQ